MTRDELVHTEDYDKFREALVAAKISPEIKRMIIRERLDYLWEKYKPEQKQITYTKEKIRRKNGR